MQQMHMSSAVSDTALLDCLCFLHFICSAFHVSKQCLLCETKLPGRPPAAPVGAIDSTWETAHGAASARPLRCLVP